MSRFTISESSSWPGRFLIEIASCSDTLRLISVRDRIKSARLEQRMKLEYTFSIDEIETFLRQTTQMY